VSRGGELKIKCTNCGTINFLEHSETERRRDPKLNTEHILCVKCCKEVNWESDICKHCPDRKMCNGTYNEDFKKWTSGLDGV